MGLDISKITNAELQKLAYKHDGDNNNVLNAEEFAIFKQEALQQDGINPEDFNQAMGLYKTEVAVATEPTVQEPSKKERKAAKKALESRQNDIKDDIKALIEGEKDARLGEDSRVSLNNLISKLQAKNTNSDYAEVIADVQEVVNFVNGKFNNKKEVEALEKKIKKNPDFNKFQKDLAEKMVELAKREQINKEAEVLVGIYEEIKADKNNAQNFTGYLNKVKTEMESRNLKDVSYYSDEAFKALEEVVIQDIKEVSKNKRKEMIREGAEHDSENDVKDAILDSLPETDKLARKVVKKEKDINGVTGRWLDRDRRAEDLEKITEKELRKELGDELFNILNRNYLHTKKNEDGTYNVRDLSDKMFERVGYDVWMNMSDDTQMSELQGVKNELKVLTGRDLSDKDIKKIMKLVHIKKEPKDRNFVRAVKDSIIPGLAGAIAGASAYSKLDVTQRVRLNMDSSTATDMIAQLKAAGINPSTSVNEDGTITVTVLQKVLQDNRALAALAGAGIGVLTGTIANLIFGMENNEKSCISIADFDLTDERYTNIDNYEKYIRETQPEAKADLVVALAKTFKEEYGDDWAKEYDSMLKKFAGRGSVLNCLELRAGQLVDVKNEDNKTTHPVEEDHKYSKTDKDAVEPTYEDVPAIDGSKTGWAQIARQYDCLVEKYQLAGAIRVLKLAQAITNGDYSQERLDQLYDLSKKGRSHLKNIEGFDYQKYCDALDATYLPALKYDGEGNVIKGTGVKVPETLGDCPRNAELSLKVIGKVKQAEDPVAPTGHAADRRRTSDGSAAKFYVRLDGGAVQEFDDKATRDGIVKAFKEKYPNAKIEKWED